MNTKLELYDVDVAIKFEDHVLRVEAKEMSTSPYDPEVEEEEGEKANSRRVKVTDLSIYLDDQVILHPVSFEVIASFGVDPLSLNYCNICVLTLVKVALSDIDIDVLKKFVGTIVANQNERSKEMEQVVVQKVDEKEKEEEKKEDSPKEVVEETKSSWSSSIWNYGTSWFKPTYVSFFFSLCFFSSFSILKGRNEFFSHKEGSK
jgi:hypothetical protein